MANFATGPLWVPARVIRVTGPQSYEVSTTDRLVWRRHIDQLRRRVCPAEGDSGKMLTPDISAEPEYAMEGQQDPEDIHAEQHDARQPSSSKAEPEGVPKTQQRVSTTPLFFNAGYWDNGSDYTTCLTRGFLHFTWNCPSTINYEHLEIGLKLCSPLADPDKSGIS